MSVLACLSVDRLFDTQRHDRFHYQHNLSDPTPTPPLPALPRFMTNKSTTLYTNTTPVQHRPPSFPCPCPPFPLYRGLVTNNINGMAMPGHRCMPSAQNSVVILQMEKKPELASSMAKTLTAVYLLSAVPIACLLSAILQFVQL